MKSTKGNSYKNQKLRGVKRKLEAVRALGGKCSKCGYCSNLAALDFHHKDPKEKTHPLDTRHISNRSVEALQEELNKCILLCANCHREEHNPLLVIESLDFWIENQESTVKRSSFLNKKGRECRHCKNRFPVVKGKVFCSERCKIGFKNYPTLETIQKDYEELKSWNEVAKKHNITRKIIQNIRNT